MRPTTARQVRALRAVAASALTTLFAATAHTLGGGAPAPTVLLIATVLSMPVALALAGRRGRRVRTALAVVGSQAVYHVVFAVFGMSASFAGQMPHMHGTMPRGVTAAPASAMDTAPMMGLFEPLMLTMHAAAAAVTVVILLWGERLLRIVARMLWPAVLRLDFRPITVRAGAIVEARHPSVIVRPRLTGLRRRGPPVTA